MGHFGDVTAQGDQHIVLENTYIITIYDGHIKLSFMMWLVCCFRSFI